MLVVTSQQMAKIEKKAFEDGCSDDAFMVLAGANIAKIIQKKAKNKKVILFCGKGNNGGDAYVAGYILLKEKYVVEAYHFTEIESCSRLNKRYFKAFQENGGKTHYITNFNDLSFPDDAILVDALLGTGFKGALKDPYLKIIKKINSLNLKKISIDIPSGLDGTSGVVQDIAVKADYTAYLGLLKAGFFLNDGPNFTGELIYADFGLPKEFYNQISPFANYFQKENVLLPVINKKRHKYNAGYVLGIAGSFDMPGAAVLSALAALRSGAGIVRLYSLDKNVKIESKPLEVIHQLLTKDNIDSFYEELNRAAVVFIGPGMGRTPEIGIFFIELIKKINKPIILDADALFFLAKNPEIKLPVNTVLTPHHGEMLKILNEKKLDDLALLEKTISYANEKRVIIVLKGAVTFVVQYGREPFIVSEATPALASAGTGDVLTGIISSQVAQNVPISQAAMQGAFIHNLAAKIAEKKKSTYGLIATDVIEYLPDAFKELMNDSGS
jgi:ADP-dependent NAD(P)H-hydrate dehydratase / NAD(P)H-hydrate epimerase